MADTELDEFRSIALEQVQRVAEAAKARDAAQSKLTDAYLELSKASLRAGGDIQALQTALNLAMSW
jgi:hypothetical protein